MALETGTYISDLVVTNPVATDPLAGADDHLRLIKTTIKNTFPNLSAAVTPTASQLNNVVAAFDHRVPSGGIIMWSGAANAIPTGWFLCNGLNGTPDLRNRFVVGAGDSYAVGATGGNKDAVVIDHSHSFSGSGTTGTSGAHTHSISDSGHSHLNGWLGSNDTGNSPYVYGTVLTPAGSAAYEFNGGNFFNHGGDGYQGNTSTNPTGISVVSAGDHTHSVSISGSIGSTGESGTNKNLPPYYALCFIMKA